MKQSKLFSVNWLVLIVSLLIGAVLALAAWGKLFYPAKLLKTLDQWIGVFEIVFLLAMILLRKQRWLWLGASNIFAAWGGYAVYWCCLKLPCNCMGAMLNIPSVLSISMDLVFYAACLALSFFLGTTRVQLYLSILCSFMMALVGYAFADWIYQTTVAP